MSLKYSESTGVGEEEIKLSFFFASRTAYEPNRTLFFSFLFFYIQINKKVFRLIARLTFSSRMCVHGTCTRNGIRVSRYDDELSYGFLNARNRFSYFIVKILCKR